MSLVTAESVELAPPLERRRLQAYLLQVSSDGAMLLIGFALAGWLYLGDPLNESIWGAAQLLLPLFWTVALMNRTYGVGSLIDSELALRRLALALGLSMLLVILVLFLARSSLTLSRFGFSLAGGLTLALQLWMRINLQPWIQSRVGPRAMNVLVVDDGGPPLALPETYRIDAAKARIVADLHDPHALDRLGVIVRNMDRVIVSCPPERRSAWAMVLKCGQMRGEIVDSQVEALGILGTSRSDGTSTLIVASGPLGLRSRLLKRGLDLAISLPVLLVLAMPMLLLAVAIRLEDGGPALFRQPRVGRNNQFFTIYKFRTMRAADTDTAGARSTEREDRRITRIGAFLRRTSIDELPQLINVVKGDMSHGAGRYLLSPVVL